MRGGGVLVPVVTALLAFVVGGLVVLATGANPIDTYKAIFEGSGLNWLFPWVTGDDRMLAALNLQQTLILTTPLILTGLAVAFAFRAGLFNIGGQGQYLVGTLRRRLRRLAARRHAGAAARRARDRSPRCVAGARVGRHRRRAEGDDGRQRGDLDDHAQLDRASGSASTCSGSAGRCRTTTRSSSRSRSPTTCSRARGCRSSGATRSCRACTSASSSRSPSRRCSGCCSTAR